MSNLRTITLKVILILIHLPLKHSMSFETLKLPSNPHSNLPYSCTIYFSHFGITLSSNEALHELITQNFPSFVWYFSSDMDSQLLSKRGCSIKIIHFGVTNNLKNPIEVISQLNKYIFYSFFNHPHYSVILVIPYEWKSIDKLWFPKAHLHPYKILLHFLGRRNNEHFPSHAYVPLGARHYLFRISKNETRLCFSKSKWITRSEIPMPILYKPSSRDHVPLVACRKEFQKTRRNTLNWLGLCGQANLLTMNLENMLNFTTVEVGRVQSRLKNMPLILFHHIDVARVPNIYAFYYESGYGKIWYCKTFKLANVVSYPALWIPYQTRTWVIIGISLCLYSIAEALFGVTSIKSFFSSLLFELYTTYTVLMSQEDDRKTFHRMAFSFSILILTSYYKEFIIGYLIAPPDPHVIQTLNEFLDKGGQMFARRSNARGTNFSKARRNLLNKHLADKYKNTTITILDKLNSLKLVRWTLNDTKNKKKKLIRGMFLSGDSKTHKDERFRLNIFINQGGSRDQIAQCYSIKENLGSYLIKVDFYSHFALDKLKLLGQFYQAGLFKLWRKSSIDSYFGKLYDRIKSARSVYVLKSYVTLVNLIPVFSIWSGLLLISLGLFLAERFKGYQNPLKTTPVARSFLCRISCKKCKLLLVK